MAILYSRLRSPLFIEKTGSGSTYLSADMTITINSTVRYVLSKDTDSSYKVRYEISELLRDYLHITWDGLFPYSTDTKNSKVVTASLSTQFFTGTKEQRSQGIGVAVGSAQTDTVYGFDAYSDFSEGINKSITTGALMQTNTTVYFSETLDGYIPFQSGTGIDYTTISASTSESTVTVGGTPVTIKRLCDPIHDVIRIIFVNKFGAFQEFYFTKKHSRGISVSSEKFDNSIRSGMTYSVHDHKTNVYNKTGKERFTVNTDFLDDSQFEALKELLLSELTWVQIGTAVIPIVITTETLQKQTRINDSLVRYTIEFETSADLINNIN